MSLGKSDESYWRLIEKELHRRFFSKHVEFCFGHNDKEKRYSDQFHSISIYDESIAVAVLKDLGASIQSLSLLNETNEELESFVTIPKLVEEHCSEWLDELILVGFRQNFFENITKPFKRAKEISLIFSTVNTHQFSIAHLFPSLRHLKLAYIEMENVSNVVSEYPRLTQLSVAIDPSGNKMGLTEEVVINLIRKNPQIRKLALSFGTPDSLNVVAEHLLNLEQLDLHSYTELKEHNFHFHFEHVKIAKIGDFATCKWPTNITFGEKLEELYLRLHGTETKFLEVIERSKNLKKLHIGGEQTVNNDVLLRLTHAKLNVTEIHLYLHEHVDTKNIIQLIESDGKLTKVDLVPFLKSQVSKIVPAIEEHFKNQWKYSIVPEKLGERHIISLRK